MEEGGWTKAAKDFGQTIRSLCDLIDAVDYDINVEDYPRVMYEAGRRKMTKLGPMEEEAHQEEAGEQQDMAEVGDERRRTRHDKRKAARGRRQEAARGQTKEEGEDEWQYPESPRTRRTNPTDMEYGGWDAMDSMTEDQCARMPMGI